MVMGRARCHDVAGVHGAAAIATLFGPKGAYGVPLQGAEVRGTGADDSDGAGCPRLAVIFVRRIFQLFRGLEGSDSGGIPFDQVPYSFVPKIE
jgi:hypothetical protein